jgi:uncharacterized protein with PIN domain
VTGLWQLINSINAAGGIEKLAAKWSPVHRKDYAAQLRKLRSEINRALHAIDGTVAPEAEDAAASNGKGGGHHA